MASVVSQTLEDWELIVVDDGSTDETLSLARSLAAAEPRCRVLALPNGGVGPARNQGVMASTAPWVVFLDSDDWLLPEALASFRVGSEADPEAGVIVGRWSRVTSDGTVTPEMDDLSIDDVFDVAARYCPFAIHAAAVRREHLRQAGAFDPSFRASGDWDFWQRLARTGARFSRIDVEVARYRTRPNSIVMHPEQMLDTGLRIIEIGHGPDPRVVHPDPRFAAGRDPARRASARISFAVWPAAMLLGMGRNANVVLQRLEADEDPDVDPRAIASSLYTAALLPSSSPPEAWRELYPRLAGPVHAFLRTLEATSGTPDLAARVIHELERRIIGALGGTDDLIRVDATAAVRLELTRPIADLEPGEGCDRLHCELRLEGNSLGTLDLPVPDGVVSAGAIADAVSADHGWHILGVFFARTIYPALHESHLGKGRVTRGVVTVGPAPPSGTSRDDPAFHDLVGWTVFLQELWGKRRWPEPWFYRSGKTHDGPAAPGGRELMQFEISESDRWIPTRDPVLVTVGGAPLLAAALPARRGARIGAITTQGGYELCRLAVREGLLGQPLDGRSTLRARLARAALKRREAQGTIGVPASLRDGGATR